MSHASSLILGIETSCDETAAAVVRADDTGTFVLSNVIASQNDLHAEYRGVVPEIASRAHAERLLPIIRRALADSNITMRDISAVAVGHRPGLIGCLLVGVSGAKALAWSLGVPVIGVDHVHAHLYAPCLDTPSQREGAGGRVTSVPPSPSSVPSSSSLHNPPITAPLPLFPSFPALGLVVSGGHTSLYRCESPTRLRRLGSTIDDAVGEAYDKAAAILGLPFPGGPAVDRLAQTGNPHAVKLPISRLANNSLDFSFSGLKTALLYATKGVPAHPLRAAKADDPAAALAVPPAGLSIADLAASFQRAAIEAVMLKIRRALEQHPDCRTLLVGGGVSANSLLRTELTRFADESSKQRAAVDVRVPPMTYCLDNAAMLAGLGYHLLRERNWTGDSLDFSADPTSAIEISTT